MKSLLAALLLLLSVAPTFGQADSDRIAAMELRLHQRINQHRKTQGLKPLERQATLERLARQHSQEMAAGKVPFSHEGFQQRVKVIKAEFPSMGWSENVAYNMGHADPVASAFKQWLKSKGHRKNMENADMTHGGIGVAIVGRKVYFTQLFATASPYQYTESDNGQPQYNDK